MKYIPHPADTSGVKLDESIAGLAELLAKNTHELWAQERRSSPSAAQRAAQA